MLPRVYGDYGSELGLLLIADGTGRYIIAVCPFQPGITTGQTQARWGYYDGSSGMPQYVITASRLSAER